MSQFVADTLPFQYFFASFLPALPQKGKRLVQMIGDRLPIDVHDMRNLIDIHAFVVAQVVLGVAAFLAHAQQQQGADWDFELASAKGFGEAHGKLLGEKMGGKGSYAVFVGSLTVPLHNAWADAAIAYIKANYPDMKLVGDRYGVAEDLDKSRSTALDLMSANQDLKGFLAFGSQGPIGAGRAVEERRKDGKVFVIGPFSPGQGAKLIKSGALTGGFMWNPKQAGEVFVTLADRLSKGETPKAGDDIPGLGKINPEGNTIVVDQLLKIDKESIDKLVGMGL